MSKKASTVASDGASCVSLSAVGTGVNCLVENSVIWGATGNNFDLSVGSASTVRNSRFKEATGENGNISSDPLLTSSFGLRPASPCRNAGRDIGWTAADVDLAGRPRLLGTAVDMGCYECTGGGFAVLVR